MSVESFITEHLELWTEAVTIKSTSGRRRNGKIELTGIKKLRELILELAIRGKLLPQNPQDEPADILLKRVTEEQKKLEMGGQLRIRQKKEKVPVQDLDFELPKGWQVAKIASTCRDWGQKTPDEQFSYLDVASVDNRNGWISKFSTLSPSDAPSRARKKVQQGTVIYSTVRPYLQNIAVIEDKICPEPIASTAFAILHPLGQMPPRFFLHYLRSPTFVAYVESVQTGVAYPAINDRQFFSAAIPVPPLAEQHRIVQKVDELMALCDRLEQQTHDQHAAHETLVDALLDTLTQSANADELANNWARLAAHADTLFTTEHSIDRLKQAVLQLGVMGPLVNQIASDAPASALLKDIACNNEKIVKDKNAKIFRTLDSILESEKPFELPDGWQWCRLGQLGYVLGGATPSKNNITYWNGDVPWVTPKDMKVELISSSSSFVTNKAVADTNLKEIPAGSLLVVVRGMILAHSFPTAINDTRVTINQDIKALVFSHIDKRFMLLLTHGLKSHFTSLVDRSSHGTCKITSTKLWNTLVPVPPENEQHRIVQKVDELMAICDRLKARLNQASETRRQMADAVTEQAIH